MTGWTAKLGYVIAFLTLLYFIVYAFACPTKELVAAVALEVFVFIAVVGFRTRKKSRQSREAQQAVLDELSKQTKFTGGSWRFFKKGTIVVLSAVAVILGYDFFCLGLTLAQQFQPARVLYLANPIYRLPGVHSALSAELLAGAYIEAGQLAEAEKLSVFLLSIREDIYGKEHPMIAEMYGNFAFISLKKGDAKTAEQYAIQSIALWKKTSGYHHLGNALTKLGNALTMQKRYEEAQAAYQEALVMREKEFGKNSERVLKTLIELESCLKASGKLEAAKAIETRINSIQEWQKAHMDTNNPWFLPISILASFALSYVLLGPKGVLTNIALRRIEKRILEHGANANPKDVQKLISLYNHRKDKSKVEFYEAWLSK